MEWGLARAAQNKPGPSTDLLPCGRLLASGSYPATSGVATTAPGSGSPLSALRWLAVPARLSVRRGYSVPARRVRLKSAFPASACAPRVCGASRWSGSTPERWTTLYLRAPGRRAAGCRGAARSDSISRPSSRYHKHAETHAQRETHYTMKSGQRALVESDPVLQVPRSTCVFRLHLGCTLDKRKPTMKFSSGQAEKQTALDERPSTAHVDKHENDDGCGPDDGWVRR